MISVLIPTYNYNVKELIESLHNELINQNIAFEIIIYEDGSTSFINSNIDYSHTKHIINKENIGRINARKELANLAQYDWLLFLDADVLLKQKHFISNYFEALTKPYDVIFGGIAYHDTKPKKNMLLRWKYGRQNEEVSAINRNKKPYKVITSGNYIIKASVFNSINKTLSSVNYGYDNYFSTLLSEEKRAVLHIDNQVYHVGIEKSEVFINKTEQAIKTLLELDKSKHINNSQNSLLNLFSKLKVYKLTGVFNTFYRLFGNTIKRSLLGNNPSITLLQLYKISYMCHAHKK